MRAYVDNHVVFCPKCGRPMRVVSEIKPDHTHLMIACHCDGILYSMPRPSVVLEPVRA